MTRQCSVCSRPCTTTATITTTTATATTTFACGHVFHTDCLTGKVCPVCSVTVAMNDEERESFIKRFIKERYGL